MSQNTPIQLTPLTPKADRTDPNIRLFEEAVLRIRGRWPGTATGLCTDVNRLYGFGFGLNGTEARERMLENRTAEALRLVEALYGPATVSEVRRAAEGEQPAPMSASIGDRHARRRRGRMYSRGKAQRIAA